MGCTKKEICPEIVRDVGLYNRTTMLLLSSATFLEHLVLIPPAGGKESSARREGDLFLFYPVARQ